MDEMLVGSKVKHKVGKGKGVVVEIKGEIAVVSYDFDKKAEVPLVALEQWDPDEEATKAVAPFQF